jgi:hypothetical protein
MFHTAKCFGQKHFIDISVNVNRQLGFHTKMNYCMLIYLGLTRRMFTCRSKPDYGRSELALISA